MPELPDVESTRSEIFEAREREETTAPEKPWNKKGHRQHLGGSVIGEECARKIWFQFRWAKDATVTVGDTDLGEPPDFPGRIYRLFETGDLEEDRLIADLERIGCEVFGANPITGEQFRISNHGGHFGGSQDALVRGIPEAPKTWHLGEFKTHSKKSFNRLKKKGVRESKPRHYTQMNVYMGEWNRRVGELRRIVNEDGVGAVPFRELVRLKIGRLERAVYLAQCKDTDDLLVARFEYDSQLHDQSIKRAKRIIEAQEPPERISDDPTFYKCGWCDFQSVCHSPHQPDSQFPDSNCRTCAHSKPNLEGEGGEWLCGKSGYPEPIGGPKAQFEGCEDHLFHPELMPWDPVAFDEDNQPPHWIAYQPSEDGRRIVNCTEKGAFDVRQWVATGEFEQGLSHEETIEKFGEQQFPATSFQLAEKPLDITEESVQVAGVLTEKYTRDLAKETLEGLPSEAFDEEGGE